MASIHSFQKTAQSLLVKHTNCFFFLLQQNERQVSFVSVAGYIGDHYRAGCCHRKQKEVPHGFSCQTR